MYLILKNHGRETRQFDPYGGAICIISNRPWFVTGKQGPDMWADEAGAHMAIGSIQDQFPGNYEVWSDTRYREEVLDVSFPGKAIEAHLWAGQIAPKIKPTVKPDGDIFEPLSEPIKDEDIPF